MRLHERESVVQEAELYWLNTKIKFHEKFDGRLTDGEELRVIAKMFGDWLGGIAKFMIREERHPGKPDRPGGLE